MVDPEFFLWPVQKIIRRGSRSSWELCHPRPYLPPFLSLYRLKQELTGSHPQLTPNPDVSTSHTICLRLRIWGSCERWGHKRHLPTTSLSVPASSIVLSIRVSRRISAPQTNRTHSSTPPRHRRHNQHNIGVRNYGEGLGSSVDLRSWLKQSLRHWTWCLHLRRNHMTPFHKYTE